MAQSLVQQQEQVAVQQQRLAAFQLLQVKLLSMPLPQLEEAVRMELNDNPALETSVDDNQHDENNDVRTAVDADNAGSYDDDTATESFETTTEREERADALEGALNSIGSDDRLPDYETGNSSYYAADYEEMVYGNTVSFYDNLREQLGEVSLSDEQQEIVEYIIGSLDDDGLLRKDAATLADELAIYHNIDVEQSAVEEMITVVQSFDPPGIGARSLQECLLIQIDRKLSSLRSKADQSADNIHTLSLLRTIIDRYFRQFTLKQWHKIAQSMHIDEATVGNILDEIKRLNPRPGAALGEAIGRSLQQITPDFIVDSDDNGNVSVSLSRGQLPSLTVSSSFSEMVKEYQTNKKTMTKSEKEAYQYAIEKVGNAQTFIDAINLRRTNMLTTMRAIAALQHDYFISGDDNDLRPMVLKDIAERCNLSISTVSRVTNLKYIQTRWGIIPVRKLFDERVVQRADGNDLSTIRVQQAIRDAIDSEDKQHPLGDESLRKLLSEKGFQIARRTIAKYREKLGIPVARLRKEYRRKED